MAEERWRTPYFPNVDTGLEGEFRPGMAEDGQMRGDLSCVGAYGEPFAVSGSQNLELQRGRQDGGGRQSC